MYPNLDSLIEYPHSRIVRFNCAINVIMQLISYANRFLYTVIVMQQSFRSAIHRVQIKNATSLFGLSLVLVRSLVSAKD